MDIVNKLKQIGLSNREAEVYLALLQKYDFTVPELTKITKVTRTKIYEILQNLIHKGVCNESYRNGLKIYRAIKPKLAIQNIISYYENEIEQKKKNEIEQMEQAGIAIEKVLISLYKKSIDNNKSLDYVEVLTNKEQIKEKWIAIQESAKKEILVFSKPPYTAQLIENINEETDIIKKEVIVRSIYEYKDLTPKETGDLIKSIEAYQEIGEEARIIKQLPIKLVVSDATIAMFALKDKISLKQSITSIVIDHPDFAILFKEIFENYWTKSITVEEFKRIK